MKSRRVWSILLTTVLAGVLTACGSSGKAQEDQTDTAAEQTAAETQAPASAAAADYAEVDDGTGFAVRKWIGAFADCQNSETGFLVPGSCVLDDTSGVSYWELTAVMTDLPEDFDVSSVTSYEDLHQYYSECLFPAVVFSAQQDITEEELRSVLDSAVVDTDYTLTPFVTESGLTMYQVDSAAVDTGETLAACASEESKAALEAMQKDWEQQRTQLDYLEYQAASGISFQTVDYDGNAVNEEVFWNAELTMVNIWATTCSYCIQEMPALQELNDEMENVQVITILVDVRDTEDEDGIDEAHDIMATQNVTLPVLLGSEELDAIFPITGTPTSYLVDQNGNIVGRPKVGAADKESYEEWIQNF